MREWLTKDFFWKVVSVILAVVIWFTIHIYEEPETSTPAAANKVTYDTLPVTIVSTSADARNFRVAPATVAVTVEGPSEKMAVLQANQIRAEVDVTDVQTSDAQRRVDISTPTGVTVVSIDPPKVAVIIPPPPEKKP
ncbi:MAG: hypothetical protein ACREFE_01180 [Limisphaerales bacterium]